MAKNGSGQKLIFWKNISSDLALVLRNFALWVNENDEIWLVAALHEKFFRVPKLRFLASPASLLDEVSTGTQNWSVIAVTTSNQSISVIFQVFRPFLVTVGHFGHFWPIFPQAQNCRKLVMWPLKTIARRAEFRWRWFWMSLSRCAGHFWSSGAFLAIVGQFSFLSGHMTSVWQFWVWGQNWTDPVSSITNCYCLRVSYTDLVHSFIIS